MYNDSLITLFRAVPVEYNARLNAIAVPDLSLIIIGAILAIGLFYVSALFLSARKNG